MTWLSTRSIGAFFEIGGAGRFLPMEGVRGIAVGLVFLQHYCKQFVAYSNVSGGTLHVAQTFAAIGNFGVELFFVLSGYLIYGILLRKRPSLAAFMARRAQRLYPAFLVALTVGALIDFARPMPKLSAGVAGNAVYLLENIAFIPGLFPIDPLFAVNWSLSYEWWFYATATVLFSVLGLAALRPAARVSLIVALAVIVVVCAAGGVPNTPERGLCLLAGMLLVEAEHAGWRPAPGLPAIAAALAALILCRLDWLPPWCAPVALALGFGTFCSATFGGRPVLARPLSWRPLRWFGNMSYSYYLVHGFVVVAVTRATFQVLRVDMPNLLFWTGLLPVFILSVAVGAALFLWIEKPLSLAKSAPAGLWRPRKSMA